jgi:hypothetical protein
MDVHFVFVEWSIHGAPSFKKNTGIHQ